MEYFQCENIAEGITKIICQDSVYAYLIEGSQQVALVDTGYGIGDLKALVAGMTGKPVMVICTHGHVDHAGGAYGFETVYLSQKDEELVKVHTSVSFRSAGFGPRNGANTPPTM